MTQSPFLLDGKTALITGGGTGLGFGISRAFLDAGAKIVITGRRENVLQDACEKLGDGADYRVQDVSDQASAPGFVKGVEADFGPVDILVNNAGINLKKHFLEVSDEELNKIIQTNVAGLFSLTREVGRFMVERKKGAIVNITSMAAIYGISGVTAYSTSKTALLGMTRTLAVDLSPSGVRVNAIAPGFIDSPMLRKAFDSDPDRERRVLQRTPMHSLGKAEDIAWAALYLASDASKFVTGVNLPVDGGNSIGF